MRIVHWVKFNQSGMNNVATALCAAEKALGLNSWMVNTDNEGKPTWPKLDDFDISVVHTHISNEALYSNKPIVWIAHGTPEVMFTSAYEQALINGGYAHADAWMLTQFWLKRANAIVTFWPRHAAIWKSLVDRNTNIHLVPMGVDTKFWQPVTSLGKFAGKPSVFTAENSYTIKWPYDLFIAWPWILEHPELHDAKLHAIYVPKDQHRFFFPLVNANGASFGGYISAQVFDKDAMRNAFCSTDFYCSLVRYGDFNTVSLEARASGAKIISYEGNPYATHWISEGDQRRMAAQLIQILTGKATPRTDIATVNDVSKTAEVMAKIYQTL